MVEEHNKDNIEKEWRNFLTRIKFIESNISGVRDDLYGVTLPNYPSAKLDELKERVSRAQKEMEAVEREVRDIIDYIKSKSG